MRYNVAVFAGLAAIISFAAGQPRPPEIPPPKVGESKDPDGPGIFAPSARAHAQTKAPVGAEGFTIHLDTEIALENGPIVYCIRLENRTSNPGDCLRHSHSSPVRFTRKPDWVQKPNPSFRIEVIGGSYGPYHEKIEGGKAATQLIAVQERYQRIPPGRALVEFEWDVVGAESRSWYTSRRSWGVRVLDQHPESWEPVRGRQMVEVQPATPQNIAKVKEKLEQYLRDVTTRTRSIREVIECLTGSRHPEFVPVMIRAVQLFDDYECRELLDTVYDCFIDSTAGFERLFPLLEAGEQASHYLLDYWDVQAHYYVMHQRELVVLANLKAGKRQFHGKRDVTDFYWDSAKNHLEVWNYARPHSNSRLTLEQHARIQDLKNVWVRAMYWQRFPEWCSPYWIIRLYADLKRTILPHEGKAVDAVCKGLAHDRFLVRERAMADAMKMDERIVPALREYHKQHPSAEFEQRIGTIARHFEQQPVLPIAARVIESAMYSGSLQGELIFQALSAPAGSSRLADSVRAKQPEQQKRRQEELDRQAKQRQVHEVK